MATFMPGARISQAHGTVRPADPETGAADALVLAMYHPAAALRTTAIAETSLQDMAGVPGALVEARRRRAETTERANLAATTPLAVAAVSVPTPVAAPATAVASPGTGAVATLVAPGPSPNPDDEGLPTDQMTLF
jgi:hypothetical protein